MHGRMEYGLVIEQRVEQSQAARPRLASEDEPGEDPTFSTRVWKVVSTSACRHARTDTLMS